MTAHEIVETLLSESPFVGNNDRPHGYIGIVDNVHGNMQAQWADDLMHVDHSEMGRGPNYLRWRYATNRVMPTVLWSGDPTEHPEVKAQVEAWLDAKGFKVASHTWNFNSWMGY